MITISLDEYGEFEKEEKKPLFIAGLIFDDNEKPEEAKKEEGIERKRIRAYYKKVISEAGEEFSYPQDLHSNGDAERDHNVIGPVKNKVAETFPEFITKGTYDGKPLSDDNGKNIKDRKGIYHLFVMLKSDDGKKRLLSEHANMLAKDDWAANRYFHMAGSVVNRIIFHNPLYPQGRIPAINIDIATRSTGNVSEMERDLANEFTKQAYRVNEADNSNYKYYSIMNADIYRTLIAQEMVNSGNIAVKIEKLYVKSIQYDSEKPMMEFLYLSDSLCSMLGFKLKGVGADDWLEQIADRVNKINPNTTNLIFGYDEIDNDFAKAWNYYENKEPYEALSKAYDAKIKKGKFPEHYRDVWFPYLERRVRESITPELFSRSVNNLSALLTANNLNQEKLLYLMEQFELMVEKVFDKYKSTDMRSEIFYKLYDAGVTAFCHVGNAAKALEYYEKCKEYSFYVDVSSYMNTNNKMVVCLEDSFEWEKALEIAAENVDNQQFASELKRGVLKTGAADDFLEEAKSVSQLARIYAEFRDEKAEHHFRKALSKLEKGSANYKITQSYLLHYYADLNMKEAFHIEIQDYFDGKTTHNQRLKYITSLRDEAYSPFSKNYAIYVLVRGLYCFYQEEIDESLWEKLCNLDEAVKKNSVKPPSGHPWEITYNYLEMLAIKRKDDAARHKFSTLKRNCLTYRGDIIEALEKFGDAEVADIAGDYELRDKITGELSEYMREKFACFTQIEFSSDGDERYAELQKYFTFMYH